MKTNTRLLTPIEIGRPISLVDVATLSLSAFQASILDAIASGWRVVSFFAVDTKTETEHDLVIILANDEQSQLCLGQTILTESHYPSITPLCSQAQLFEREIAEQFGLIPDGHPWMKPVRYQHSWTGMDAWGRPGNSPIVPGSGDFFKIDGEQVHEVSVGPVHAGIIEPGHFRFQCHGEKVFHLQIALGYQHRGIEKAFLGGPDKRSLHYAETIAGDSTIAHSLCYCEIIEGLSGLYPSPRSQFIRGISLELERLANHIGDIGALSGDAGFLQTASYCGRIRGDFLNMSALITGNRFGRGLIQAGGVNFDIDKDRAYELIKRIEQGSKDCESAINLLWENQSVLARFENIGVLTKKQATDLGIVGPAARASGLRRDVRFNFTPGMFRFAQIPVSTCNTGDVFARAYVRWLEIQQSIFFVQEQLASIPAGVLNKPVPALKPDSLIITLNEAWRGETCHVAITDQFGRFRRYKIIDPSFHNWFGLTLAMRDQEISDFPLCNKSFNLSYCGHDL